MCMCLQAVRRLVNRNGLSEDEAIKRVGSQITNEQRVAKANVVLCTLWEPEVTQKQVILYPVFWVGYPRFSYRL